MRLGCVASVYLTKGNGKEGRDAAAVHCGQMQVVSS